MRFGNILTSVLAGLAAFAFTLSAFLMLRDINQQILASFTIGMFALSIVWLAYERPNSAQARAASALIDRLLAVGSGDLTSPSPAVVRREMPALAAAVDGLFEQVRSTLDDVSAMALYDPVTALPNRSHFRREADRMLKARKEGERLALLFIDLDGFKEVNDNLGHAQGDQVLCIVANRLRALARAESRPGSLAQPLLARLAGDEFTMLFPHIRDSADAERIARAALTALNEPYETAGQGIDMGASIGVALCPRHDTDLTGLMKAADIAMYRAKANGRAQLSMFRSELAVAFERKGLVERELRDALARGEFELAFQPQICVRSGAVLAGEALIRWRHPSGDLRSAESFIRIAEESSLIVEIGDWVVESVAATLKRWHDAGLNQRLSFNIGARHFSRPDFFGRLRGALQRAGAPISMLELELNEGMAMKSGPSVITELAALRAEGATIAIDNFGIGLSNLGRLRNVPLDRIKLDASLTHDIDTSDMARTVVAALIHLIHGLGCEVAGERVERREQLDVLRAVGCDSVQGHVFAQPMSETDFLAWVAAGQKKLRIA
ncbi:MAG TPA: bifunctional diguanylate cyclase/phosphodiesterase [Allosphingosinicella sp.]|uniref:putative bifunctional diguanylate cyclase/phosphodiesterase n=1 Tax=Allosphingosinicella sp. TaxID=2823234 RepID=UPI002F26F1B8